MKELLHDLSNYYLKEVERVWMKVSIVIVAGGHGTTVFLAFFLRLSGIFNDASSLIRIF